jgi:predicted phosphodiesterase
VTDSTRVAVLSDIHGNLPALEAVLADVEQTGVDLIILNGDLADGPFPVETLELLAGLGERARWVRGNGDRWVVEAYDGVFQRTGAATDALTEWTASLLSAEHRDLLAAAPLTTSLELPGIGAIGFCHATARDDNEMVLVDSPIEHFQQAFVDFDQPTVVIGHCHMPFDRLVDRRRIVNAGAVGMPYGHTGASWALIGSDVTLRRTHYDTAQACRRLASSTMPDLQEFLDDNVCSTPSDAEALEVFGKIRDEQFSRQRSG